MGRTTALDDDSFTVYDGGDTSKRFKLEVSAISGTTVATVPRGSFTFARAGQFDLMQMVDVKVADYTAGSSGASEYIPVNTASGAVTITLPAIVSGVTRAFTVADFAGTAGTNSITVTPFSGQAVGQEPVGQSDVYSSDFNTYTMVSVSGGGVTARWCYL